MKRFYWFIHILLFCTVLFAQTTFLALIDETENEKAAGENCVRYRLEIIFNYWNIQLDYRALSKPYPTIEELEKYDGIVTFFQDNLTDHPIEYIQWLVQATEHNKKLVIVENPGINYKRNGKEISLENRNKLWNLFDLKEQKINSFPQGPLTIINDPLRIANFERNLTKDLFRPDLLQPINEEAYKRSLSVRLQSINAPETVIATYNHNGLYIQPDCFFYISSLNNDMACYYLDMFRFIGIALDKMETPIPDCTTLMGRRIVFHHIDGDGFNNISKFDKKRIPCSEVFYKELFKKHHDILFGVSVITSDIDPLFSGTDNSINLARKIYALPNVEIASHTAKHPMDWEEKTYYKGAKFKFDRKKELDDSVDFINTRLAPPEKKVKVLYWTGYCNPAAEDLARVKELGIYNINGGNNMPDMIFPSIYQYAPVGIKKGNHYQIYSVINNENDYTKLWTGPFWGFRNVTHSFKFSDKKYRLKPIDHYFHFYSGEYRQSIAALNSNIKWILKQNPIQVFPSKYCGSAEDFFHAKVERTDLNAYEVHGLNVLQTLRVESKVIPDLSNTDILGFNYDRKRTYIHLTPACEKATIRYTDKKPKIPYILSANVYNIHIEKRTENTLAIHAGAPIDNFSSEIIFQFPGNHSWKINIGKQSEIITPDNNGNYSLKTKLNTQKLPIVLQKVEKDHD